MNALMWARLNWGITLLFIGLCVLGFGWALFEQGRYKLPLDPIRIKREKIAAFTARIGMGLAVLGVCIQIYLVVSQ